MGTTSVIELVGFVFIFGTLITRKQRLIAERVDNRKRIPCLDLSCRNELQDVLESIKECTG